MELIVLMLLLLAVVWLEQFLFGRIALKGLTYRCTFSTDEVEQGADIALLEVVENRKWLPVPWLKTELTTSKWLEFADSQSLVTDQTRFVPSFFMVGSYQKVQRNWKVHCAKRGVFEIHRISLVSTDILGLVSLTQAVEVNAAVTVLPVALDIDTHFVRAGAMTGDTVVRRNLVSDPFYLAGVREYRIGDPMNRIHWGATAKLSEFVVHQQDYTTTRNVTVVLNMQSRPYEKGSVIDPVVVEEAIATCTAILEQATKEQVPIRLLVNGAIGEGETETVSGEYFGAAHLLELKRALAGLSLISTEEFSDFLQQYRGAMDTRELVIVTAYLSEEICDFARGKEQCGLAVTLYVTGRVNQSQLAEDLEIYCMADRLEAEEVAG